MTLVWKTDVWLAATIKGHAVSRPALASRRLALTPQGQVRYSLQTPWRDGTTHVVLEPLDSRRSCASLRSRHLCI